MGEEEEVVEEGEEGERGPEDRSATEAEPSVEEGSGGKMRANTLLHPLGAAEVAELRSGVVGGGLCGGLSPNAVGTEGKEEMVEAA